MENPWTIREALRAVDGRAPLLATPLPRRQHRIVPQPSGQDRKLAYHYKKWANTGPDILAVDFIKGRSMLKYDIKQLEGSRQ